MKPDKGGINSEMIMINDTDFVRQKWRYEPAFTTADTSSISDLYCTTTSTSIADEIDKRVNEIYRRREAEMAGITFNDLEKELKEFGIELSTIRHSSMDVGFEIEGYFNPDKYKRYRDRERLTQKPHVEAKPDLEMVHKGFKTPKIRKDGKWIDLAPKKVIFSGPATTILWKDGTKTTVKCSDEDSWSDDVGIAMCYLKKMLSNKGNYNNIFREAMKVAEVQTKKEELTTSTAIEGESYYSSALDSMKRNIDEINDFMKDAADALDKALGGKK